MNKKNLYILIAIIAVIAIIWGLWSLNKSDSDYMVKGKSFLASLENFFLFDWLIDKQVDPLIIGPEICTFDVDCDDENNCTIDKCEPENPNAGDNGCIYNALANDTKCNEDLIKNFCGDWDNDGDLDVDSEINLHYCQDEICIPDQGNTIRPFRDCLFGCQDFINSQGMADAQCIDPIVDCDCPDDLPCANYVCLEEGVCSLVPKDCSDGDSCNGREWCDPISGMCLPGVDKDCNDNISCTVDSCSNNRCRNVRDDSLCDDNNPCTEDICTFFAIPLFNLLLGPLTGGCAHNPIDCSCENDSDCEHLNNNSKYKCRDDDTFGPELYYTKHTFGCNDDDNCYEKPKEDILVGRCDPDYQQTGGEDTYSPWNEPSCYDPDYTFDDPLPLDIWHARWRHEDKCQVMPEGGESAGLARCSSRDPTGGTRLCL